MARSAKKPDNTRSTNACPAGNAVPKGIPPGSGFILRNLPMAVCTLDIDGQIEYANPAFLRMTGLARSLILDSPLGDLLVRDDESNSVWQQASAKARAGKTWRGDICLDNGSGRSVVHDLTLMGITGRNGKVARIVAMFLDKDEFVRKLADLDRANDEVARINQSTSDFISDMSHTLRTHLTSIIGFSEMLNDRAFGPLGHKNYEEFAGLIDTSARLLLDAFEVIVNLNRVAAGRIKPEDSVIEPGLWLRKILAGMAKEAADRGVELVLHDAFNHRMLQLDENLFRQIATQLLRNAIRHSPHGSTVETAISISSDGRADFCVSDTGPGMSEAELAQITRAFYRRSKDDGESAAGPGLGLTLVREYAALHGAILEMTSTRGQGTQARVLFPSRRVLAPGQNTAGPGSGNQP